MSVLLGLVGAARGVVGAQEQGGLQPGAAPKGAQGERLPVRANAGDTVVELTWEAPPGLAVKGYRVYRKDSQRPIKEVPNTTT